MRRENWPSRLTEIINAASSRRFLCGEYDCFIFCADVVEAITGRDLFEGYDFRGKYKTPKGAIKLIKKNGFVDIEAIWDHFAEPVDISFAQRGDIILIDVDEELPATGPVIDSRAAFLSKQGVTYRNVADGLRAWRID